MKFVTKGLVLLMMGAMLAGCSDQSSAGAEGKQGSVESSQAVQDKDPDKSSEVVNDNASSDDGSVTESSSEDVQVSVSESTEDGDVTTVDSAKQDELVAKYKEYFKNYDQSNILFDINVKGEESGIKIDLNMKIAVNDGNTYMNYSVPGGGSMDLYVVDNMAYLKLESQGTAQYYKSNGLDDSSLNEMNLANNLTDAAGDNDHIKYYGTKVINGKTYDILTSDEDGTDVFFYMNRETGEWERLTAEQDGMTMEATVSPAAGVINVPAEFASAEEIDSQELYVNMAFGIYALMAGPSLD